MSTKSAVMGGMIIGSTVGGYIPSLFGADIFSVWSIITSAVGGLLGIWIGFKLANI